MIFVSIALVWIGGFLIGIAAGLWMAEGKAQRENRMEANTRNQGQTPQGENHE